MKKFLGILLLVVCTTLIGLNFQGRQSVVNLGRTSLFTAPASGRYFITGYLSLPQMPQNSPSITGSQVVASVSKNGATLLYYGVPGANGFSIPSVQLVSNDSIAVALTSNATVDQGLNVIKGDIFFGSKF